jgi:hypothetical protein
VTYRDARLKDKWLLAVAAQSLLARRDQPPPRQPWWEGEGISNLLDAAPALPRRDPFEVAGLDPTAPGLAGCLARAKLGLPEPHRQERRT